MAHSVMVFFVNGGSGDDSQSMSITNQSLGGRAYLVKKLMSGGFSRRKSVAEVSVILERMIDGLRWG